MGDETIKVEAVCTSLLPAVALYRPVFAVLRSHFNLQFAKFQFQTAFLRFKLVPFLYITRDMSEASTG